MYFLVISVLMLLGTYLPNDLWDSPLSPYSTFVPLVVVLSITTVKEGLEDLKRHKSDREINTRVVQRLMPDGSLVGTLWRDVRVGDVVRVNDREEVPADLILLLSSEDESSCHVETSNSVWRCA